MMIKFSKELWSMIYLGFCFMVSLTPDFTVSNMQKILNKSIKEDNPDYTINPSITLGLIYTEFAIFLWLLPSVITKIGTKCGLIIGSLCLGILVFSFTLETNLASYIGTVLGGIGGSLVWVSQGSYVIMMSTPQNISLHVGIVWVCYSCSMIFGNVYATEELRTRSNDLHKNIRHTLLYILTGVSLLGAIAFLFLPKATPKLVVKEEQKTSLTAFQAFKKTLEIFVRTDMLLLIFTFCYVGFQHAFGQGVYASCIGFTERFGHIAKSLVPMAGLFYGLGDLIGGVGQMILGKFFGHLKFWASGQVTLAFIVQATAYVIIYINLPNSSTFGETNAPAIVQSSVPLALLSSFFLGLGDSFINVRIYPLLAKLDPVYSTQTCAIFKFIKTEGESCSVETTTHDYTVL